MIIKEVWARKILDSSKRPTIEVSVNGSAASSPSGTSVGKHETPSYHNSLDWNIEFIKKLKIPFEISSFSDLKKVERQIAKELESKDAKIFGANALFALESAILKALANSEGKELWQVINPKAKTFPIPVGNAVGGGMHSAKFAIHPTFQEFLLIPKERTISANVRAMNEVYFELGKILNAKEKNDEGAWQVQLDNEQILDVLERFKGITRIGLDVAASSFYIINSYKYRSRFLKREEQIEYINRLIRKYNLFYVEDPLHEEDFSGFSKISRLPLVVGDDLTATHKERLKMAIREKAISAMIVKPNQNGSLVELKEILDICKKNRIKTILSHRSGETLDTALADYAFAFQADFIKCGISTKWRECKLKRLVEIERSLK